MTSTNYYFSNLVRRKNGKAKPFTFGTVQPKLGAVQTQIDTV